MISRTVFGLFGTGGCGRGIMPFVRESLQIHFGARAADVEIVFVETAPDAKKVNGVDVLSEKDFFRLDCEEKYFNVGIADSKIRELIAGRCRANNIAPLALQAAATQNYGHNDIGEGVILCPYAVIAANVKIGKFFHGNLYSYVEHDCVIGDYVTFAPRVNCNGNVHIGNHVYVGTTATIKQGTKETPLVIGDGAVIGMGAVVTKDVAPYTTVIGNPARVMEKA